MASFDDPQKGEVTHYRPFAAFFDRGPDPTILWNMEDPLVDPHGLVRRIAQAQASWATASAFRHEQVEYLSRKGKGQIHWNLPAVISSQEPWLPKELRLAEIVRNNMSQDRKTLAFVEQSGTRDIRDRLRLVIETLVPGGSLALVETPQVGALSASDMTPAKREAWIRLSTPKMDALLVNPRLVETGLDLVMFSVLVFYEVTTSLYVLWQAMRRSV